MLMQLGGPRWSVTLGRRDARTASQAAANTSIPPPTSNLSALLSRFSALGLSAKDMVALSGLFSQIISIFCNMNFSFITIYQPNTSIQ